MLFMHNNRHLPTKYFTPKNSRNFTSLAVEMHDKIFHENFEIFQDLFFEIFHEIFNFHYKVT